jgi:hypothetical protein
MPRRHDLDQNATIAPAPTSLANGRLDQLQLLPTKTKFSARNSAVK